MRTERIGATDYVFPTNAQEEANMFPDVVEKDWG